MATHQIIIRLAGEGDLRHIHTIVHEIEASADVKGTGICKRSPEELAQRMREGTAVIAATTKGEWVGFCYIKAWDDGRFVSTCALIVAPAYRKGNVATRLKAKAFALARKKYPSAALFGLTTSRAVMKINNRLGFTPVTYSEITKNETFWDACKGCPNYQILTARNKKACLCTAMLFHAAQAEDAGASFNRQRAGAGQADETSLQKKCKRVKRFADCVLYSLIVLYNTYQERCRDLAR